MFDQTSPFKHLAMFILLNLLDHAVISILSMNLLINLLNICLSLFLWTFLVSETFHFYGKKLAEFYEILCRMVFESYGVNKCYDFYAESNTLFLHRVNKYRVPRLDESTVGVSDHTDLDFITILHQNHVDGLEVKTKDGNWISVQFPPSSFVIMAGEGLRAWSNGRIYSAVHRVILKGKEERFSTAQMSFPKRIIEAPEELVTDKHSLQFKPFANLELLRLYYTEESKRAEDGLKAWFGI
nr:probable 2-oxoglutarate-dependent dioxygenase AOP1.2 isoform X1 [Nicotiana tomentosiformis]